MKQLVPITLTDAMVTSSDIAEPSASETAWVSAGSYTVGDRRIRVATHREYECLVTHTGITTNPEDDPTRWLDIGPTDKWAMFDSSCTTQSTATNTLTVVLEPGFFNAVALYNLTGSSITITVKDQTGGTTIASETIALDGPYIDWYEWLFDPYRYRTKVLMQDILPYSTAEITITITTTGTVGIGMVTVGDLRSLVGDDWGGTRPGATAEPVDFSYIKTDDFGETVIVRRKNATDMRAQVFMPSADADYALACVQDTLAVPCAWIASDAEGFDGLNVFGLGSGSLSYDGNVAGTATLSLYVKGLI